MTNPDLADEIIGRFREALDRGEAIDPEQLIRLHPELGAELRLRFAALRILDRAYTSARAQPDVGDEVLPPPLVGSRLGPFLLEGELGTGGMGTVYLASAVEATPSLPEGAVVALKVIHPHLPARPGFRRRFEREGRAGRKVRHEHVVATHETGVLKVDGRDVLYLAMEFVEGRTLRQLLGDLGPVPEALVREIARQVADGLAAIHAAGIVHRDLKPENVLVTDDDEIRIMDLGVARLLEESKAITAEGQFAGSVLYAAPEQFQGGKVTAKTDLYALGVMMYELATGENPFRREGTVAVVRAHLEDEVPPLAEKARGTSPFLSALVAQLLAKDPEQRPASADDVSALLEEGEQDPWWTERERELHQRQQRRPRPSVGRDTKLCGRKEELERIQGAWKRARRGEGGVVAILGEAGIGKTRFVDAFLESIEHEDATVLYGQYAPSGGAGGLTEGILSRFGSGGLEEQLAPYLPSHTALLAPFTAAVVDGVFPPGASPLPADTIRTVFVQLLRALAAERPVVWIVDDLHFASAESRRIVLTLARAATGHPILIVVTADPALPRDDLAHLSRVEAFERIDLGRLSPREVVELLRDAFGSDAVAEKLGVKVAWKSDGVPFFVFEMIRGLREKEILAKQEDGTFTLTRVVEDIEVPSVIRDLVQARLRDLSKQERAILDAGSIQGFEFDAGLVARALERKRVAVLQDLAEIERRSGLVKTSGRLYRFDHHQIRDVVYADLNSELAAEYHTLVAQARTDEVEAHTEADTAVPGELAAFLAYHHLHGVEPAAASPYLRTAVEHLGAKFAHEEAAAVVAAAMAVEGLLEGTERVRALDELAHRYEMLGRWNDERDALQEGIRLADTLEDASLQARLRTRLGTFQNRRGSWEDAHDTLQEACRIAGTSGDPPTEVRAATALGDLLESLGRNAEALDVHEQALRLAREHEDEAGVWQAARGVGSALRGLGRLGEAEHYCREAYDLVREGGRSRQRAQAATGLANVLKLLGRHEEALALYQESVEMAQEVGAPIPVAYAVGNLGNLLARMGRFTEALQCHRKALDISRESGDRRGEVSALGNIGNACLHLDRLREARRYFEQFVGLARELAHRGSEAWGEGRLGDVQKKLGDLPRALGHFERARDLCRETGNRRAEGHALGNLGAVLRSQGRSSEALEHIEASLERAQDVGDRQGEGAALGDLAALYLDLGAADKAEEHFGACLRTSEDLGDQRGLAFAEEGLGKAALLRGRNEEASLHLERACELAKAYGGRRREALITLGLGRVAVREKRSAQAKRHFVRVRKASEQIGAAGLRTAAVVQLAALSGDDVEEARRSFQANGQQMGVVDRIEAAWLLWTITDDPAHLALALTDVRHLQSHAPEDLREGVASSVPLHAAVLEAARERGMDG